MYSCTHPIHSLLDSTLCCNRIAQAFAASLIHLFRSLLLGSLLPWLVISSCQFLWHFHHICESSWQNLTKLSGTCWSFNLIMLLSLLAWLGRIAAVEVVNYFFCMLKSWRIVSLLILVVSLPLDTILDLFSNFSSPLSYLPSALPSGIQYIINLPLFLVVDYNRRSEVIVLAG